MGGCFGVEYATDEIFKCVGGLPILKPPLAENRPRRLFGQSRLSGFARNQAAICHLSAAPLERVFNGGSLQNQLAKLSALVTPTFWLSIASAH
jgi:hypothetical protein